MSRHQLTAYQQIEKYYLSKKNNIELSATVEEMRLRILEAHDLMMKFTPKSEIALTLSKLHDVSERTIYNDLKFAELLFGNILKMDKDYMRAALQQGYMKAFQIAVQNEDWENMEKFGYRLEKVTQLHHTDLPVLDPSTIKLMPVQISTDPDTLDEMRKIAINESAEDVEIIG